MSSMINSTGSFDFLYAHLLTLPPPLLPPGKSTDPKLTDQIASLYVHPAIEAALHILNADLPSAHFLVRHMQDDPQFEAMYLHGILHRVEGDYDNARAWYRKISSTEVFRRNWSSEEEGLAFVGRVEALKKKREGDKGALGEESVREIREVIKFCVDKFGKGRVEDARGAWKQPDDEGHRKIARDMVSGGKGHRDF